jgi:23S rRNA pseudouridine2604 synthase
MEEITYPVRVNRYLLLKDYTSRREADRLIEQGKVKINGKTAVVGQKVEKNDKVEVNDSIKDIANKRVYLAFNKPQGVVTHDPIKGQKSIEKILKYPVKVFPIGRLDKDSHGLILLTNDGRVTDKLLNPRYEHEKEYVVQVDRRIDLNFIRKIEGGVKIQGRPSWKSKPAKIEKTKPREFHITLTEGKKHQIRRMCAALGYKVSDLKRVRVMNITLGKLGKGRHREIKGRELNEFLQSINVNY